MQKISGIIPSSSRVTTVDLKNGGAARPGMPSFGRPQGVSTLARPSARAPLSASQQHRELMQQRSPIDKKVAIIKELSDGFFMRKAERVDANLQPETELSPAPSQETMDFSPVVEENFSSVEPLSLEEDLDAPEVGRYIDVSV